MNLSTIGSVNDCDVHDRRSTFVWQTTHGSSARITSAKDQPPNRRVLPPKRLADDTYTTHHCIIARRRSRSTVRLSAIQRTTVGGSSLARGIGSRRHMTHRSFAGKFQSPPTSKQHVFSTRVTINPSRTRPLSVSAARSASRVPQIVNLCDSQSTCFADT
jgi:hypothetical protein